MGPNASHVLREARPGRTFAAQLLALLGPRFLALGLSWGTGSGRLSWEDSLLPTKATRTHDLSGLLHGRTFSGKFLVDSNLHRQ